MDELAAFAQWLRRCRNILGLTQESFAETLGYAVVSYRKVEQGARPSLAFAQELARYLQLTDEQREHFIRFARTGQHPNPGVFFPRLVHAPEPEARRPTLPEPANALLGRERELADLIALATSGRARLISVIGPPGVGKTRLAEEAGQQLQARFRHGAYFVSLAPVRLSELVLSSIAQAVEVLETGYDPLISQLISFFQGRQVLLILDNFEQAVPAAPQVARLIESCPQLTIIVTSRMALDVRAERQFPLAPLALPSPSIRHDPQQLAQCPSFALFVERTRAIKPDLRLDAGTSATIAEICMRSDGLPLVIELIAARSKLLPPQALLGRLSSRLQLLTSGARDLPARQQTLRNTLNWSYELLEPDEQRLLARLGVFVGGASFEAIEAICGQDIEILNGLDSLIDKSLLQHREQQGGEPRFTMLETIREYASEQLACTDEHEALRQRHAEHYLALAEQAEPGLSGAEQASWMAQLADEHDNLRAALEWALQRGAAALAMRMAGALSQFWYAHGHMSEGRHWLEAATSAANAEATPQRVKALYGLAQLTWTQEPIKARELFRATLQACAELSDQPRIAQALRGFGTALLSIGDFDQAHATLAEAQQIYQQLEDMHGIADTLCLLGWVACYQEQPQRARELCEQSLQIARRLDFPICVCRSLSALGWAALHEGQLELAVELQQQTLTLVMPLNHQRGIMSTRVALGWALLFQGSYVEALRHLKSSLASFWEMRMHDGMAEALEGLGYIAATWQEPARAGHLWGAAEASRRHFSTIRPPLNYALYQVMVREALARLDRQIYEQAWAEAQSWSAEQAVRYALDQR